MHFYAHFAPLFVNLRRQCSLRCDDCYFAILTCLPTNQTEMRRRATLVPHVFSLRSKLENLGQRPDNKYFLYLLIQVPARQATPESESRPKSIMSWLTGSN